MRSSLVAIPLWVFLAALLALPPLEAADTNRFVRMLDGTDLPVRVYPADTGPVLLWFPSEHGVLDGHHEQGRALQETGVEVWLPDPFAGYFLPTAPSSFDAIPAGIVPQLIEAASQQGTRPVFVFGNDRAAPWLLEGLRDWQTLHPNADHLAGLILMSPYLHTGLAEIGKTTEFHPIVRATNLPIHLIQPVLSPQYPLLPQVRSLLAEGGSDIATRVLPEVRDRFFFRPNTLAAEEMLKPRFAAELVRGMRLLARLPSDRVAADLPADRVRHATPTRQERMLEALNPRPRASLLRLPDLDGDIHDLADYGGEVLLINFWASWCPPCVHEMPSMQRLEDRFRERGFRILAVNLGESEDTIRDFLELIGTDFTILLDPERRSLAHWRAMAYPSSYIVDREGLLSHYLFGAIEWNEPGVVAQIAELLDE